MISPTAGFSLIEVMIAILILGIALVGLTQGVTTALHSNKESELQTVAALFAQGQMETLRAQSEIEDETVDGECGSDLPGYSWKMTISPSDPDGLHEVDIEVDNRLTRQPIFDLKTLLFQRPEDSRDKRSPSSGKPGARR